MELITPTEMVKTKEKELALEDLNLQKKQLAVEDIPDWKKKMVGQHLDLEIAKIKRNEKRSQLTEILQ